VDSLVARIRTRDDDEHLWTLLRPAAFTTGRAAVALDTLTLEGPDGARLMAAGTIPVVDSLNALLVADSVPPFDVRAIAQIPVPLDGIMSLTVLARGVRDSPRFAFDGRTIGARVGELQLSELRVRGDYEMQRLTTEVALARSDTVLLRARADLPLDLALLPRER